MPKGVYSMCLAMRESVVDLLALTSFLAAIGAKLLQAPMPSAQPSLIVMSCNLWRQNTIVMDGQTSLAQRHLFGIHLRVRLWVSWMSRAIIASFVRFLLTPWLQPPWRFNRSCVHSLHLRMLKNLR